MLVYSTQFQVKDSLGIEEFIILIHTWIYRPNSRYNLPEFNWKGEEELIVQSYDKKTTLSIYVLIEKNTVAIKLSTVDDKDILWDNYYSLVQNELYVELQKYNQNSNDFLNDTYHLPYIFNLLYDNNYVLFNPDTTMNSGEIKYISLDDNESIELSQSIILKENLLDKPIVYITHTNSLNYKFPYAVNIDILKKQLLGLAYVIVEKSADVSLYIRDLTYNQNPYKGAIEIHYPNGYVKRIIPHFDEEIPEYKLRNEIVKAIFDRLSYEKIDQKFSLSYISNEIHKGRIKELKKNQNKLEALQEELNLSNDIIHEMENEIEQYKSDICTYQAKCSNLQSQIDSNDNANLLSKGNLEDLYDGEILDCIYDILSDIRQNTNSETRKYEMLTQILETNKSKYKNSRKRKIECFKKLCYDFNKTTDRFISQLKKMGLEVYGGSHSKIKFPKGKQIVTLSSTPSDRRSADNAVSEFRKLF